MNYPARGFEEVDMVSPSYKVQEVNAVSAPWHRYPLILSQSPWRSRKCEWSGCQAKPL